MIFLRGSFHSTIVRAFIMDPQKTQDVLPLTPNFHHHHIYMVVEVVEAG